MCFSCRKTANQITNAASATSTTSTQQSHKAKLVSCLNFYHAQWAWHHSYDKYKGWFNTPWCGWNEPYAEEAAHSLNFQSLPQGKAEKPGLPSPTTNGICFITLRQRKPWLQGTKACAHEVAPWRASVFNCFLRPDECNWAVFPLPLTISWTVVAHSLVLYSMCIYI